LLVLVDNDEHCDFLPLRRFLVESNLNDLRHTTNDIFYESFRVNRLLSLVARPLSPTDDNRLTNK
jgi:septin 7